MGYQKVELNFEMLWVRALTNLLVKGETIDFLAKNGAEQVKVVMRGVSDHAIVDQTHTFDTFVTIDGEGHPAQVTATFKPGTDFEVLSGKIEYNRYPKDNMSE